MKPLPKSMREDYRYITVKIGSQVNRQKALELVLDSVNSYAGEKGLVNADPKIIDSESNFSESEIMVRINREAEDLFRASLVLSDTRMCTLKVSGSSI